MTPKEYQNYLKEKFIEIFPTVDVYAEKGLETQQYNIYSPRLDVIVGPLAIDKRLIQEYDSMMEDYRNFIDGLIRIHNRNVSEFDSSIPTLRFEEVRNFNENSRCFISIEIENNISRKHLIGGAINASGLGRVGIFFTLVR